MKNLLKILLALAAISAGAHAVRYPIIGGPGLVHLQSAKIGAPIGYRTINLLGHYSGLPYLQNRLLPGASYFDAWTNHTISYSPHEDLAVLATFQGHGNLWSVPNMPAVPFDKTLGNVGDASLAFKYHRSLLAGKLDLGIEPMLTIPFNKKGTDANGDPVVIDRSANSGRLDFGAKLLADYNLDKMAILANLGLLTRGKQRPQLPLGAGIEYGLNQNMAGFLELSGELRMGATKDELPDSLVPRGVGFDRAEFRITPGIRLIPIGLFQITVAAEIGLTHATAPWQLIVGLDVPAAAGRSLGGKIQGQIAGRIKDRDSGVPMKGMITFPGADIPGTVSDSAGQYDNTLPPGEYKIHIYANGYRWLERKINVEQGKKLRWDLTLKRKLGTVNGKVSDAATGAPVRATVRFAGTNLPAIAADSLTGEFTAVLPPGKYTMTVSADGYAPKEQNYTIKDKQVLEQPFKLEKTAGPAAPLMLPAKDKQVLEQPSKQEKTAGPAAPMMLPAVTPKP